jgi:hypothetical protein
MYYFIIPVFHYSTIPLFHHSTMPSFNQSIISSCHYSSFPPFHHFVFSVSKLDSFAVSQLEKLEQHLPIITKPVPQVKEEATKLYDATLRPTVDRLSSVTKYGVETVTSVKDKGVSTVSRGDGGNWVCFKKGRQW